jgi:hypothetical protein
MRAGRTPKEEVRMTAGKQAVRMAAGRAVVWHAEMAADRTEEQKGTGGRQKCTTGKTSGGRQN